MGTTTDSKPSLKWILWISLAIIVLMGLTPLSIRYFLVTPEGITAASIKDLPTDWQSDSRQIDADLDHDGSLECIHLDKKTVELIRCDDPATVLWQNPSSWKVDQAMMADLNRDGITELVLAVTRPFAAWPVDQFMASGGRISTFHDSQGQSSHLILIGWKGNRYREVWAGSALYQPLRQIEAVDADDDGFLELLAIEGNYDAPFWNNNGNLSLWKWNGFGFSVVEKIPGRFSRFELMKSQQQEWIIAGQ